MLSRVDILKGTEKCTCTMPSDRSILLPILTGNSWTDKSDLIPKTDPDLISGTTADNEYGANSVTLDGRWMELQSRISIVIGHSPHGSTLLYLRTVCSIINQDFMKKQ